MASQPNLNTLGVNVVAESLMIPSLVAVGFWLDKCDCLRREEESESVGASCRCTRKGEDGQHSARFDWATRTTAERLLLIWIRCMSLLTQLKYNFIFASIARLHLFTK